jgi:Major Facilitator Superfamily
MSLFYTRFEFGRRLSLFYGQYAVAGAFGGLLAYGVFSRFPVKEDDTGNGWRPWQILFLLEGSSTMVLAIAGFFWLPHNARTAWFLTPDERVWAEKRIQMDLEGPEMQRKSKGAARQNPSQDDGEEDIMEEAQGLLSGIQEAASLSKLVTDDRGLSVQDILEAMTDWRLWYLLFCNILSAVPVTAFSVFLPLVLKSLTSTAAYANLLLIPPYVLGAVVLYAFSHWSDKSRQRIVPILWSLGLLISGLGLVVLIPPSLGGPRYLALCALLAGTFVASPLTIAWFANNYSEAGKRSVVLGVNGWGNVAGVIASSVFQPKFAPFYTAPFFITLGLVGVSFIGYFVFKRLLVAENQARITATRDWTEAEVEDERLHGRGPIEKKRPLVVHLTGRVIGRQKAQWMEDKLGDVRRGDERMTFLYSL